MIEQIDTLILVQMVIIGLCIVVQSSWPRRIVAAIFASTILAHDWMFHSLFNDLFWYYVSAGAFDLVVIMTISNMRCVPRLGLDIQIVSIVSMTYNFIGLILYIAGHGSIVYYSFYAVLYSWAIFVLLRGEPEDAGNYAMDSRISAFRLNAYSRHTINHPHQEA